MHNPDLGDSMGMEALKMRKKLIVYSSVLVLAAVLVGVLYWSSKLQQLPVQRKMSAREQIKNFVSKPSESLKYYDALPSASEPKRSE